MSQLANQRIAWFNGKYVPESQVLIPFRDRSWKYGDGAFDMTRTFDGRAFRLKEHIDRFYRSMKYLRIDPGMSPQEMIDISEEIVARNEHLRHAAGDCGSASASAAASTRSATRAGRTPARRWWWSARRCRSRAARASTATASTSGRPRRGASRRTC